MKNLIFLILAIIIGGLQLAPGQTQMSPRDKQLEELRSEVQSLRHELDSLKEIRSGGEVDQADQIDQMEQQLDQRISQLENKIDAVSRAAAATVLNPRTTAFINFAARADNQTVVDATGAHEINNKPFLRTVELELRNPVDPYAEAVTIISIENEAGKDFAVDAEEAYGLIKRLPILEQAPLGLKMKIGKFRAPLGLNNKIHMHDLPWTTRPLVVARLLGTEHGDFFEAGFNPTGIDLDFFLPNPIPQTTLEMNIDVARAGDIALAQNQSGNQPAYITHLNLSKDWSNIHLFILGLSGYYEHGPSTTHLIGADVTYKWAPAEERESHSIVAGGEAFFGRHSSSDSSGVESSTSPYGWFSYLQYQTSYWLYWGLRYDWLREPSDDRLLTQSLAAYASYYTTEFLRFRLGFEHRIGDLYLKGNLNTVTLEANFVFGSHPTEPYWVNK